MRFELSPSGDRLPDNLGSFDFVALSAVFVLNQTPFRFYPQEAHTTGLPGLNYLPDRVAYESPAGSRRASPPTRHRNVVAEGNPRRD